MSDPTDDAKRDSKRSQLERHGSLHPHPDGVTDPLFDADPFFDRRDAVQVKYEMLRSVSVEGRPVSQAAAHFGFSRPTFYQARAAFDQAGLPGLLPAKKGPRRRHKLSKDVLDFVLVQRDAERSLTMAALSERVHDHFGVRVHPRSIQRALDRRGKKNP
jgi:transposase